MLFNEYNEEFTHGIEAYCVKLMWYNFSDHDTTLYIGGRKIILGIQESESSRHDSAMAPCAVFCRWQKKYPRGFFFLLTSVPKIPSISSVYEP